jgi:arginase
MLEKKRGRQTTVSVLGAASHLGQRLRGPELGPTALRTADFYAKVSDLGWSIEDFGDVHPAHATDGPWDVAKRIEDLAYETMSSGSRFLLLGGDHSVFVGSIRAALRVYPDLEVVWVDAHGDMNTPETSPSGNAHGMPLALLMGGFGDKSDGAILKPAKLSLIGVRSLDEAESSWIAREDIRVASADEVKRYGVNRILSDFGVLNRSCPIHLSVDIDGFDPSAVWATGLRVSGGLTVEEGTQLSSLIAESGRLVSMDLVELNPKIGTPKQVTQTIKVAHNIILAALGPVAEDQLPAVSFEGQVHGG